MLELKQLLQQGKVNKVLLPVGELEEISLNDKINKIDSYGLILLIQLMKQNAKNLSTRAWKVSVKNVVREIEKTSK
ncbi:hypothetical protein [Microcoleus sp. FACHB-68]|uniref:hypothetical protein n=1 Tax=Microcoleus sp. FACHB-68 TaxID=2692826 RepID=UPI0018EF5483|nr:hypothetical protein [Microcoleus sp. FACHB-68]